MAKLMRKFVVGCLSAVLLVGGALPAAGAAATPKITKTGVFVGNAESHAFRLSIGDVVLTIGGGESNASYKRTQSSATALSDQKANAKANGIVIPGLIDAKVACLPPKLADELVALATPDSLKDILSAKLGTAACNLSVAKLPTASHRSGEVVADVMLNKTIVDSVSSVNEFLDTVQQQLAVLPADVQTTANSTIDAIQANLASKPLLEIKVAPNQGTVTSLAGGIASASPGAAVVIDVLGGILQVEIALADATASVINGVPNATSKVSLIHVKALNILTPDPNDALIDQHIAVPQDISLLQGTPLATRIVTTKGTTSKTCPAGVGDFDACATGTGDALSIHLLGDPLPAIGLDLVHVGVMAAGNFGQTKVNPPVLPRTGSTTAAAVLGGAVLVGLALAVRRRLVR